MELLSRGWETLKMYMPVQQPRTLPIMHSWASRGSQSVSLDAAGLVALADLSTVARRTALTGTSDLLDSLVICPGLHRQQYATELNGGEYPACAAMTSGYVFRIENQAMVHYLQMVGKPGELTTLSVSSAAPNNILSFLFDFANSSLPQIIAYSTAVSLTLAFLVISAVLRDWWALAIVGILIFARFVNVIVIRRRSQQGWKGQLEPGVKSDLIILMSQDRWIRMKGLTDDVKAITSGEWMREPSFVESAFCTFATLLVYLDATLAGNASNEAKVMLIILLFASVGLLGLVNQFTKVFKMYGKIVKVEARKSYGRRLELARELIAHHQSFDWAIKTGMVNKGDVEQMIKDGIVTKTNAKGEDEQSSIVEDEEEVIM